MLRFLACLAAIVCFGHISTPARAADPLPEGYGRILILPFTTPAGGDTVWLGKAAQDSLLSDLSRGTVVFVMAPSVVHAASNTAAALETARSVQATIVVFGQAQVAGSRVRFTGQVLDVASGKPLGNLKVTGPMTDLARVEDVLSGEALHALPVSLLTEGVARYFQSLESAQPPPPTSVVENPTADVPALIPPDLQPSSENQPAAADLADDSYGSPYLDMGGAFGAFFPGHGGFRHHHAAGPRVAPINASAALNVNSAGVAASDPVALRFIWPGSPGFTPLPVGGGGRAISPVPIGPQGGGYIGVRPTYGGQYGPRGGFGGRGVAGR